MVDTSNSGDSSPHAARDSGNSSPQPDVGSDDASPQMEKGWGALKQHVVDNKVQVALWATRIFSILFAIGYIIPLFGNSYNAYYKALISSAATSALRLHQRVPPVQFNMQFVDRLLLEDSCHYLLYSLIFLYVAPITLVMAPVVLFAVLHSASYSLTMLDRLGHNSWWVARLLILLVEFQSRNILRLCAWCEIMLFPLSIILVMSGRTGLFTPVIYYQFLKMRLSSRRNPFTRQAFHEIRSGLTNFSTKAAVPGIIKVLINGLLKITQHMDANLVQE